jgi:hypothetical protein
VPGTSALTLVDSRPPLFTEAEVAEAAEKLAKRAGPVASQVRRKIETCWEGIRADLNAVAGGQASPRVMVLAHHAMRAHHALELQALWAEVAFGEEREGSDKHMRNQAGLAAVATDALNKAYEAAREEGKAGNAVTGPAGLLARLGHVAPGVDVGGAPTGSGQTHVPLSNGGVGAVGAPLSPNPPPPKDPE